MYAKAFKRFLDICLSFVALIVLSPLLLILTVIGAVAMKGRPFFVQKRPGRINRRTGEERMISLIKFRTMTDERDADGRLLPDAQRLRPYGKFLRSTSLDELPSLLNILAGQMSIVGPRPLLVCYLDRYTPEQRRRHTVRPGLTGYAQAYGRNSLTWEEKFEKDIFYVDHQSFGLDIRIVCKTIAVVWKREGISSDASPTMEEFMGTPTQEEHHV